eukprot:TRINITY_DN5849_c0_g1_i1.p1 TRINITY_DN5849_c0_g1~~TRINITY_DN5849_c0_g1_i1.p1  ORF type:complete len:344 (-),score=45.99 TRINITY_DN5849_c0_g1_i1:152-1066(-)
MVECITSKLKSEGRLQRSGRKPRVVTMLTTETNASDDDVRSQSSAKLKRRKSRRARSSRKRRATSILDAMGKTSAGKGSPVGIGDWAWFPENRRLGICRYAGALGRKAAMCGLELFDGRPSDKPTDGTYKRKRYFEADENRGFFVGQKYLSKVWPVSNFDPRKPDVDILRPDWMFRCIASGRLLRKFADGERNLLASLLIEFLGVNVMKENSELIVTCEDKAVSGIYRKTKGLKEYVQQPSENCRIVLDSEKSGDKITWVLRESTESGPSFRSSNGPLGSSWVPTDPEDNRSLSIQHGYRIWLG